MVSLEMLRSVNEEMQKQNRKEQMALSAVKSLSVLEMEAMRTVLFRLGSSSSGILVTSRIADDTGITRSVIVNALKKMESAGVIECKSAGMKGTNIRVLNDVILSQLEIK